MADQYFKYVDGVLKSYTAVEYEAAFGEVPTQPRPGDLTFGGRYENRTFYTASEHFKNSSDDGLIASLKSSGSLSSSYNIDFGG